MNKKSAFTLTEVLITMGVIGIISALTVPTLVNNYQRKAMTVQLRKVANDMSNAADMLMTEEGKSKFSATTGYSNLDNFVRDHFKILKTCDKDSTTGCFANEKYRSISGAVSDATYSCAGNSYVLADSAAICLSKDEETGDVVVTTDTNGQEGPNIAGRDLFIFTLSATDGTPGFHGDSASCTTTSTGTGCYELLAGDNNWTMNY